MSCMCVRRRRFVLRSDSGQTELGSGLAETGLILNAGAIGLFAV